MVRIPNHFTNMDMFQFVSTYGKLLSVRIMVEDESDLCDFEGLDLPFFPRYFDDGFGPSLLGYV